jgi:hypothetical protein
VLATCAGFLYVHVSVTREGYLSADKTHLKYVWEKVTDDLLGALDVCDYTIILESMESK